MAKIHPDATEFSYSDWKIIKSRISAKKLAEKLGLNEGSLTEFETALENYEKNKSQKETNLVMGFFWGVAGEVLVLDFNPRLWTTSC